MTRAPLVALGTVAGVTGVLLLNPDGAAPSIVQDASQSPLTGTAAGGSSSSGTSAPKNPNATGTATGAAVFVRWGTVQVRVTAKQGRITAITALQLPNNDGRSVSISQQVEPMLMKQALTAQSAHIDGVSGATFTSYGYQQSLQSALDKLGL